MHARRRSGRRRSIAALLSSPVTEACFLEQVVALRCQDTVDCIPEKVLGSNWELSEEGVDLWQRARQVLPQLSDFAPK